MDQILSDRSTSDEIVLNVRRQWAKLGGMAKAGRLGVFDSGVGGLTVYRRLRERLPDVDVTYLADSQRAPYGPQPPRVVADYTEQISPLKCESCRFLCIHVAA